MGSRHWLTDWHLWALASGLVFVALVAVGLFAEPDADADGPWADVRPWLVGRMNRRAQFRTAAGQMAGLAVRAVVIGWVAQALAVAGGLRFASESGGQDHLDFPELDELDVGPDEPWDEHLGRLVALKQRGDLLSRGLRPAGPAGGSADGGTAEPRGNDPRPPGDRAARPPGDL